MHKQIQIKSKCSVDSQSIPNFNWQQNTGEFLPQAGNRVSVVAGAALKRQLVPEVAIEKTGRLLQAALWA